jgi:hypothetical protein
MGRIFAYWAIVNFGHFFKTTKEAKMFGLLFIQNKLDITFSKNELGYVLGDCVKKLIRSPCPEI